MELCFRAEIFGHSQVRLILIQTDHTARPQLDRFPAENPIATPKNQDPQPLQRPAAPGRGMEVLQPQGFQPLVKR